MKSKTKKIIIICTAVVLLGALGIGGIYMLDVQSYQNKVKALEYTEIDITKIQDGIYIGECDVDYVYAKVSVAVKDGRITSIEILEHRNERGESAEVIIEDIISRQEIDVDIIAGATNSSKVIKKAVENAFLSAA